MAAHGCKMCNKKINRHDDKLICNGACKEVFHPRCVNISTQLYADMKHDGNIASWVCDGCTKCEMSSPIINKNNLQTDIALELRNLLQENIKLRHSIEQMNTKFNDHSTRIDRILEQLTEVEAENKLLRDENKDLKFKLDDQEQYSRRNCLEIHGLPEIDGENPVAEVIKIGRAVGMDIKPEMIDNCHRLGRKTRTSPATRGIIVKFMRNFDKMNFLKCRKIKRNLTTNDLGLQITVSRSIFINENLTQHRRALLSAARKLRTSCDLKYVWTRNGNIYVRENETTEIVNVKCDDDLRYIEGKCKERAMRVLKGISENV